MTGNKWNVIRAAFLALVFCVFIVGITRWPTWRLEVPAPGLAAGMGFLTALFCGALVVWFLIFLLLNGFTLKTLFFFLWLVALGIAVIALALYAFPLFPPWLFYGMTTLAVVLLLATPPHKSLPARKTAE